MTDSNPTPMPTAVVGDAIRAGDLQQSIASLNAMADRMDALKTSAPDLVAIQAIGNAQIDLRSKAMALIGKQIDLLAGEAKVNADQINDAGAFAQGTIAQIAEWRAVIRLAGSVVDFYAAVTTGNGAAIVQSAVALKTALDAA